VHYFFWEGYKAASPDAGTEYTRLIAAAASGQRLSAEEIRSAVTRRLPLVDPEAVRRHLLIGSLRGAWRSYRRRSKKIPSQTRFCEHKFSQNKILSNIRKLLCEIKQQDGYNLDRPKAA